MNNRLCAVPGCDEPVEGALVLPYVEGALRLCAEHVSAHRRLLLAQWDASIRGEALVAWLGPL